MSILESHSLVCLFFLSINSDNHYIKRENIRAAMEYNESRDADDKPRLSKAGTDGTAGCSAKVSRGWMTVGRKRQIKLQAFAAVVTQRTFNSVWFPLFKGVLWSGCAGYNCCLKLALRCNLIVPWEKNILELKISAMSHVHGRELTEGMWVGKANLNFIDWTEQKYQALNHSWGIVERYFSLLTKFNSSISKVLFIYCECIFVGFRVKVAWFFFLYFSRRIFLLKWVFLSLN